MIPKTIHCCWFSGEKKSALHERCLASWGRHCPGWEVREWGLDDVRSAAGEGVPKFFEDAIRARKWAFASDWVRFWAVSRYGGVYLDLDVELLAPIDDLTEQGGFFALSSDDPPTVDPGLGFAAESGDPVCTAAAERYAGMVFDPRCHLSQTCPAVIMEVLKDFPDVRLLPARMFNPKGGCAGEVRLAPDTRAIHHFSASWFNWRQRLVYIWWPKVRRFFGMAIPRR